MASSHRGRIRILNAKYPKQAVDFIDARMATGICGYHKNDDSSSNQTWFIDKNDDGFMTLESADVPGIFVAMFPIFLPEEDAVLTGSPWANIWTLKEVARDVYRIATMDSALVWFLESGDDRTSIILKSADEYTGQDTHWTFEHLSTSIG